MEQFELDMDILHSKYERVNEDLEFLIRKCDMKYIAESGTEDDLTALYTEANEQANEKKKNIFQKMLERIKAFIQKIISKIKGKKDKIEDDKEYEVDDVSTQLSESKKLSSELKNAINSKNPEKISAVNNKIKKLMIALGIGAGVTVATTVVLKKKKMKGKELIKTIDEVEKIVDDSVGEIKRISDMIDKLTYLDGAKEIEEAIYNLSHINSELVNKLSNKKIEIMNQISGWEIEKESQNASSNKKESYQIDVKEALLKCIPKYEKLYTELFNLNNKFTKYDLSRVYSEHTDIVVYKIMLSICKEATNKWMEFMQKCINYRMVQGDFVYFVEKNRPVINNKLEEFFSTNNSIDKKKYGSFILNLNYICIKDFSSLFAYKTTGAGIAERVVQDADIIVNHINKIYSILQHTYQQ